jgi:predicted Zn-dependent protease
LKGRIELLHNRVVDATQTLKHALELIDPQDTQQQRNRYQLMFNLARACEIAQQTGDAKKLAADIADHYPRFVPARLMLARLLISEHDFAGAKPQIDFLESLLSTNPELTNAVLRMRIATLDPISDAARIKAYFDRLPEESRDQKMDKAAFARLVKFDSEFLRLTAAVHASSPGDSEAAGDLADWYVSHGQRPMALQILQEAIAANPSDSGLIAMQLQAQGKAPASPDSQSPGAPATTPSDAFSNEVAQVQYARSKGDMAAADQHLAAAEKLRPDDPRIWDAMWNRAMEVSNWARASTYLEKLAAANVDHANGLLYRVHFELAKNDMPKAAQLALQLTHEKPEFSQSWCLLAQVQQAQGNYEDAIAHFQQAIELQVQNLDAIRGLVQCSYALGNIDQAKRYIDMGRRVAPANDEFKELSLNYDLTYGDPQNVIGPRKEAMQAAPENPQTWIDLASAYVAAAQSRAKAQDSAAAADYTQKAKVLLQNAMARFPDDSKFAGTYAKLCVDTGDFPAAEQAMLSFTARPSYKGRPKTAILLSDFYELSGKPDQAAKVLSDYLANPYQPADHAADVGVQLHLAGFFARQKRFDQALAVLSQNAQEPEVIRQRIALLIDDHRLPEADKALNDLAAAGPLSPDLLTLKGVAALNAGTPAKLQEARECFDQVISAQPNNSYALTQRANAILRLSPPNYAAALADLSRARDLVPGDMETRMMIVDVDRRRNQPDDAIHELESAIRLAPANKRVRLTLIDLYAQSTPPRWSDADQLLHDTGQIALLADDPDFLHEEAMLDRDQHAYAKALDLIHQAMAKAPGNVAMVHTYYDILIKSNAFDQLLSESAQLLSDRQNAPSLWWVYPYRAEALVRGSGDKARAAAELELGLNATSTLHDLGASGQIIETYATLIGADAAIKQASTRAQTDPHWLLLAAELCQQKGDVDATLSWLEMALAKFDKLSPADQNRALQLGATEYLAKSPPDTLKSADMYRRIIANSPDDVDALNNLACILVEPGSPEQPNPAYSPKEALDDSEKAYNLMKHAGQDEPLINDTYGWALIANKLNEQGLNLIRDALGKRDFAEGHYHLAEGLLRGQPPSPEDAASELEKAMKLLNQDERDGRPVDEALKLQVQEELHRARSGLAG